MTHKKHASRPKLGARLKDNRSVFLAITLALAILTIAYYLILRGRELDPAVVNNQILLFFLRNVNAILVTALAFVLIRNLTKLWFEYRRRKLGSKLKTKLVVTYIGLSLIPVLLLFALASEVVQGSLDSVFRNDNEDLLETGYAVSQALSNEIERNNQINAELILEATAGLNLSNIASQPELDRILKDRLTRLELDIVYAFQETEFVHAVLNPTSGMVQLPEIDPPLLLATLRGGRTSKVQRIRGGNQRLLLGAAASTDVGSVRTIIVTGTVLTEALSNQTRQLVEASRAHRQVQVQESEIRAVQTLTFLMVTLVLLLTCTWVGLYLARQVTVPIQALADGTRRVAEGDLEYRVEAPADDELGVLVASFNQMTTELQRSKSLLEKSNTDLLSSNEQLDRARQRIGAVLASVATGVISIDQNDRISTCNKAAASMLGISPRSLEGTEFDAALRQHPTLAALFPAAPESAPYSPIGQPSPGSPIAPTETIRHERRIAIDNAWRTIEVSTTPLRADGATTGRVIVLEDRTELIRAQKLATWNEAARRIAHEIKNPLTPIKLSAERMLKKHRDQDPTFGDTLETSVHIIVREVEKMKNLVDEFSRFARMPLPTLTTVDIAALCREVVHLYSNIREGLQVVAVTGEPLADAVLAEPAEGQPPPAEERLTSKTKTHRSIMASADGEQLRNALINLIDNAVEATKAPGTIIVRALRTKSGVRLQVADPGPGVPAEDKDRLFLPYYSTKGRGTGLGLSIVHRIVTDHHGAIHVEDNHPTGAIFSIDLPG